MTKFLEKENKFYIYGRQPVYEALRSHHKTERLILAKESDEQSIFRLVELARRKGVKTEFNPKNELQKYCGAVLHQGVVAEMNSFNTLPENDLLQLIDQTSSPLLLVMDQVQDPHNMGAIIRTAEIAGVTAVIFPEKGSAPITGTVAKTSAGAIFHIPLHKSINFFALMKTMQEKGIINAALVTAQHHNIFNADLTGPLALVVGSEGAGVRKNLLHYCSLKLSVPQFGKVESLNASVSAGIALFEAVRQRRFRE